MLDDAPNQELLGAWQQGNQQAAQVLVRRYMVRLTALARSRLSRKLARRIDPEDVVMSAWRSFFVGAHAGRVAVYPDDDYWPLLVTITLRKLARQAARHTAERRDAGLEIEFDEGAEWRAAITRDPTPDEAAMLVDEVESLMRRFGAEDREVLTRRLRGEDQATIALALNCSERTVRRSMSRIRELIDGHRDDRSAGTGLLEIDRDLPLQKPDTAIAEPEQQPTHTLADVTLKQFIGLGGFGKVYRSTLNAEGVEVAVKYLKKRFWRDRRAQDQFLRETAVVSRLSHPGVVRHLGWGASSAGALFLIMELVEGQSTGEWFAGRCGAVSEIIHCGIAVAAALGAAHAAGVVHGDVTPNNVLRKTDGTFLLTDFGFARFVGEARSEAVGGTPGFLAPEQVSELFGPVGVQTDVYGLGGLLYALLTGQAPMTGCDTAEILANVLSSKPPESVRESGDPIPPLLNNVVVRCLRKEPSERPRSMLELESLLREVTKDIGYG